MDHQGIDHKIHSALSSKSFTVATDYDESLVCIKIYPIPSVDQSMLGNAGFELMYRNKRSEVTRYFLQSLNKAIKVRFQEIIVIGWQWNVR